jgi:hypothetical protein
MQSVLDEWLRHPEVVVPLLFPFLWIATGFIVSATGGWRALGKRYALGGGQFLGETRRWQGAAMRRGTHYHNVLTIGADHRGLYLAVFFLFRPGHPPLYIPWDRITLERRRMWFTERVVFEFNELPGVYLAVGVPLGESLARAGRQVIQGEHARIG